MEVNKRGKTRKSSHFLDKPPAPSVVGALSSLEPAPTPSQPTPGSGAQAPLLPGQPPVEGWAPTLTPQHERHSESHALHLWGWHSQMALVWRRKSNIALQK